MAQDFHRVDMKDVKKRNSEYENFRQRYLESTPWINNVQTKLECAAPYYFFLTRVSDSRETYEEDLSITFPELLDSSLGKIEHSVHVNYMVELPWLIAQYSVSNHFRTPMTILYGVDDDDLINIPLHLRIKALKIKSPYQFGHHHTKMSILFYEDKSLRVVIYTANLVESDWDNRTQGVWISPRCSYMGDSVPINYGESPTHFKLDILQYLKNYKVKELEEWIDRIAHVDFSAINVFFIASVPGEDDNQYGYKKLGKILRKHMPEASNESWDLIVQCSSIGSLGSSSQDWLCSDFAKTLGIQPNISKDSVRVIYPSISNVKESHEGMLGGACLPYRSNVHGRQPWLRNLMHQWKSRHRFRSKAVPHIKTYAKISANGRKLLYFLLTSANLSKAAWGWPMNKGQGSRIWSYEVGVLFLPSFVLNKDVFEVKKTGEFNSSGGFPIPYDVPLTSYEPTDQIFMYDKCFS